MRVECGPLTFISDFDSGNFLRAELVPPPTGENAVVPSSSFNHQGVDYEVNIWTKPDAFGTKYQNGNRTWFYFAVKGGKPQGMLKLNILSLNKQIKLFEQGMQPVIRILPEQPFWERVRDRISLKGKDACNISFRQRLPNDPSSSTLFIAFTYPFAYSELCEWLDKIDDLYANGFFLPSPEPTKADLILQQQNNRTTANANFVMQNNIYYHRECVCHSLEGRRVELITITSLFGQSNEREDYLEHLFPYRDVELRAHKFPDKKVVFVSSRVHPGETPAQFVFNGFMRFLMEPKDPRAMLLRKQFVFKLIPILNPDGVHAGHYRTDPRGVNLNRVYLRPSPILHPSIYAARKLILYHHLGHDTPDDYIHEIESESLDDSENINNLPTENSESADDSLQDSHSQSVSPTQSDSDLQLVRGNTLCAGCVTGKSKTGKGGGLRSNSLEENEAILDPDNSAMSEFSGAGDLVPGECGTRSRLNSLLYDDNDSHQCTFESCDEDSIADFHDAKQHGRGSFSSVRPVKMDTDSIEQSINVNPVQHSTSSASFASISGLEMPKENDKNLSKAKGSKPKTNKSKKGKALDEGAEVGISKSANKRPTKQQKRSQMLLEGIQITPKSSKAGQIENGDGSGLFLYIDIHAHATKRGIFMYGNHFPDSQTQAECMLFPRLMAMNCQHFDFAACNFTERLMNLKDRRDGASREGSGRCAVLKLTGLVRSYTLECNYNTGRIVNHMHPRPLSFGFNETPYNSVHPPKFTTDIFEQCGRAMAESLLDLTGSNPWSRLNFTEFRTLDGMRRFLLRRLSHSPEFCVKKNKDANTLAQSKKSHSVPNVQPSSSSSAAMIYEGHNNRRNRKRSLNRQPLVPAMGPLVPKKENQPNVLLPTTSLTMPNVKPSSSKPGSTKLTKLFNKPTTSSAAKTKLPSSNKPAVVGSSSQLLLDKLPKHGALKSKSKKTSSSLTQVFKVSKKKMNKKKKGKATVSTSDLPTSSSNQ